MSHKISPARRAAFLKAVAETGNQTIAAERAKVSRAWVQLHRSTDPQFKADVAAAVAEAKAGLSRSEGRRPPSGWGHLDGEELVVKGTNGRRVQIARARLRQWTPRAEDRFLQTLSATCNVKAACAEVGLSQASAYMHRERWPAFAGRWAGAIGTGYMRIEGALVEAGCNLFSAPKIPPEVDMPPMTVAEAIHILHMHKNEVKGIGRKPGLWRRPRRLEEVQDSILGKLEAVRRWREMEEAERAKVRRGYAARRGTGQALRGRSGQTLRRPCEPVGAGALSWAGEAVTN